MAPKNVDLDQTEVLDKGRGARKGAGAKLVLIKGSNPGQEFPLSADRTTLGRGADITIADTAASREHAEVVRQGEGFAVKDLGSTNGTELNGEPVEGARALSHGDKISIGKTVLQFITEEAGPDSGEVYHLDMD